MPPLINDLPQYNGKSRPCKGGIHIASTRVGKPNSVPPVGGEL